MKLLVLNYEFPPVGGGGGKVAEDLCCKLAARGHDIRVVTAGYKGLPSREEREGFTIFRTPALRKNLYSCSVLEMFSFVLGAIPNVLRQTRAWRPEYIHAHFAVPTGALALAAHRLFKVPYVISTHLGDIPGGVPEQTDRLFRFVGRVASPIWHRAAVVTVGSRMEEALVRKAYGRKVEIVPNGIDVQAYEQSPMTPKSPVRIVFAGRFAPQKNIFFMLDVLEKALHLQWHMDMYGDGPLMAEAKRRILDSHLADRITLHGWVAQDRIKDAFSQADILFMPSLGESFAVAHLQALASGLALLTTDVGGIRELVEDGVNGKLCPTGDGAAFVKALEEIQETPTLKMMKTASRRMAHRFDLDHIADRFENFFKDHLHQRT